MKKTIHLFLIAFSLAYLTKAPIILAAASYNDPFAQDPFGGYNPHDQNIGHSAEPPMSDEQALAELFKLFPDLAEPDLKSEPIKPAEPTKALPAPNRNESSTHFAPKEILPKPKDITEAFLQSFTTKRKPKEDATKIDSKRSSSLWGRFGLSEAKEAKIKISEKDRNAYNTCTERLLAPLITLKTNILTLGIDAPTKLESLIKVINELLTSLKTLNGKSHFYFRLLLTETHLESIGRKIVSGLQQLEMLNLVKKLAFTEGNEELLDYDARSVLSHTESNNLITKLLEINETTLAPLSKALQEFIQEPTVVKSVDDRSKKRIEAVKQLEQRQQADKAALAWRNSYQAPSSSYGSDRRSSRNNHHGYDAPYSPSDWDKYYDDYYNQHNKDDKSKPTAPKEPKPAEKDMPGAGSLRNNDAHQAENHAIAALNAFENSNAIEKLIKTGKAPILDPSLTEVLCDGTVEEVYKLIAKVEEELPKVITHVSSDRENTEKPDAKTRSLAPTKRSEEKTPTPSTYKESTTLATKRKTYEAQLMQIIPALANLENHILRGGFHSLHEQKNSNGSYDYPIHTVPIAHLVELKIKNPAEILEEIKTAVKAFDSLKKIVLSKSIKNEKRQQGLSIASKLDAAIQNRSDELKQFEEKRGIEIAAAINRLKEICEKDSKKANDLLKSLEPLWTDAERPANTGLLKSTQQEIEQLAKSNSATLLTEMLENKLMELLSLKVTPQAYRHFLPDSPVSAALQTLSTFKLDNYEISPTTIQSPARNYLDAFKKWSLSTGQFYNSGEVLALFDQLKTLKAASDSFAHAAATRKQTIDAEDADKTKAPEDDETDELNQENNLLESIESQLALLNSFIDESMPTTFEEFKKSLLKKEIKSDTTRTKKVADRITVFSKASDALDEHENEFGSSEEPRKSSSKEPADKSASLKTAFEILRQALEATDTAVKKELGLLANAEAKSKDDFETAKILVALGKLIDQYNPISVMPAIRKKTLNWFNKNPLIATGSKKKIDTGRARRR